MPQLAGRSSAPLVHIGRVVKGAGRHRRDGQHQISQRTGPDKPDDTQDPTWASQVRHAPQGHAGVRPVQRSDRGDQVKRSWLAGVARKPLRR